MGRYRDECEMFPAPRNALLLIRRVRQISNMAIIPGRWMNTKERETYTVWDTGKGGVFPDKESVYLLNVNCPIIGEIIGLLYVL